MMKICGTKNKGLFQTSTSQRDQGRIVSKDDLDFAFI